MSNDVEIVGLKELQIMLATLPERISRNALASGCAAAAGLLRDEARVLAPVYTGSVADGHPPPGTLKRSIISKRINEKCNATQQTYKVLVRKGIKTTKKGEKNRKTDAYYASWVEYGHYYVARGKAKNTTSLNSLSDRRKSYKSSTDAAEGAHYVMPQPFMRPAWDAKKNEAMTVFKDVMAKKIEEAMKK